MTAHGLTSSRLTADWLGVGCSFACALHCSVLPLALCLLPGFTQVGAVSPLLQPVTLLLCCLLVFLGIVPGYRQHGDWRVATMALFGLILPLPEILLSDVCCIVGESSELLQAPDSRGLNVNSVKGDSTVPGSGSGLTDQQITVQHLTRKMTSETAVSDLSPDMANVPGARRILSSFTITGGVLLMLSHLLNIRLRCQCRGGMMPVFQPRWATPLRIPAPKN